MRRRALAWRSGEVEGSAAAAVCDGAAQRGRDFLPLGLAAGHALRRRVRCEAHGRAREARAASSAVLSRRRGRRACSAACVCWRRWRASTVAAAAAAACAVRARSCALLSQVDSLSEAAGAGERHELSRARVVARAAHDDIVVFLIAAGVRFCLLLVEPRLVLLPVEHARYTVDDIERVLPRVHAFKLLSRVVARQAARGRLLRLIQPVSFKERFSRHILPHGNHASGPADIDIVGFDKDTVASVDALVSNVHTVVKLLALLADFCWLPDPFEAERCGALFSLAFLA
eukprot:6200107-Pleurochrysis_carterae.AAC.2